MHNKKSLTISPDKFGKTKSSSLKFPQTVRGKTYRKKINTNISFPTQPPRFYINEKDESVLSSSRSQNNNYQYAFNFSSRAPFFQEYDKLSFTFEILKTMSPNKCISYLKQNPIFLKTLISDNQLNPDLLCSISLSLSQPELQQFIFNMTTEVNIHSIISSCSTIQQIEDTLPHIIPITKAIIWTRTEGSYFILSQSLKITLSLENTILSVPFTNKKTLITNDPSDHPNFNVNYDLPLVSGCKSMVLLPIIDSNSDVISVLQCIIDTEPLSIYYINILEMVRDIIQKRIFTQQTETYNNLNIIPMFNGIKKCSISEAINEIETFLKDTIECKCIEIFELDDRQKQLLRLNDNKTFDAKNGGITFNAATSSTPIQYVHNRNTEFKSEIDTIQTNHSIFSKSYFYNRNHYVITLRAKTFLPFFTNNDIKLIDKLAPIIFDIIKLTKYFEKQNNENNEIKQELNMLNILNQTINDFVDGKINPQNAIKKAAKSLFDCDEFFIADFDGRFMKYENTDVKCKFENCTSGVAYNYREAIIGSPTNPKSMFNLDLYKSLNVDCNCSFAFPYRKNGKVWGALELINPKDLCINKGKQKIICNLCTILL